MKYRELLTFHLNVGHRKSYIVKLKINKIKFVFEKIFQKYNFCIRLL